MWGLFVLFFQRSAGNSLEVQQIPSKGVRIFWRFSASSCFFWCLLHQNFVLKSHSRAHDLYLYKRRSQQSLKQLIWPFMITIIKFYHLCSFWALPALIKADLNRKKKLCRETKQKNPEGFTHLRKFFPVNYFLWHYPRSEFQGKFLASYKCSGHWYGLARATVEAIAREGLATCVHMEIEVRGPGWDNFSMGFGTGWGKTASGRAKRGSGWILERFLPGKGGKGLEQALELFKKHKHVALGDIGQWWPWQCWDAWTWWSLRAFPT